MSGVGLPPESLLESLPLLLELLEGDGEVSDEGEGEALGPPPGVLGLGLLRRPLEGEGDTVAEGDAGDGEATPVLGAGIVDKAMTLKGGCPGLPSFSIHPP